MHVRRFRSPSARLVLLGWLAAVATMALPHGQSQLPPTALSPADPYPNFDVRHYKDDPALAGSSAIAAYFAAVAPSSPVAADALASSRNGLAAIRNETGATVEADLLGGAAVVSAMPGSTFLTEPGADRVATLRAFIQGHADAYGIADASAASLVVVADEMNPAGNMAWVELEQHIDGIPVFQGHIRGAFTAKGELARTNGLLATGVSGALAQTADLSAAQAVAIAAANVGLPAADLKETSRDAGVVHFSRGAMAAEPDARPVYFPLAPGVVRLAWQTQVFGDPQAFMTVVDASTGTILFRKSLTDFQTQAATYSIYPSDGPAPLSPGPLSPLTGTQAPYVGRTDVTLIGNEAPNTFNNLGWITNGNNTTDGNNVEAGLDRDGTNGVDPATIAAGSPSRIFTATYAPGTDDPLGAPHQRGSVIDMFYWVNRYHDDTYRLGFTEAFRNFQNDNFGRGGTGNDRISAEGQDSSGTNNANFNTPADGGRGRMQMYLWTGPTPDLDGTIDHEIVVHELSHGLSSRLHANASGLSTNMARGMGEGWSDFYARALLADASEPMNAVYAMGGWATYLGASGYTANYYYGIRRFPYAPISFTGGPSNRPHNPLTFADIDSTQVNLTDGAYARGTFGSATIDQVHNIGEVWASMLYEVRVRFITRLGFAEGNRRILQFVTDGMKGDPVGPTMLQARDSIVAAANAGGGTSADIADIWAGFAARGLGVTATIENAGSGANNTRVTESFLRPGDPVPTFTINDVTLNEGNAGTTAYNFTVTLTNPSASASTVVYSTANGTATAVGTSPVGTSGGPIALPSGSPATTSGAAAPYPATVVVAGLSGTVTRAAVRLNGLSHTYPGDLDMLLVGPGGQRVMFMSDIGDTNDLAAATLTFDDGGAAPGTTLVSGSTYAPTDLTPGDTMNAPAPAGPYGTTFSTFNGTNPNGTWQLFIMDDAASDSGSLTSFTLLLSTTTTTSGDYTPTSGTLTFPPGTTTRTVTVPVVGDTVPEPSETFFVNLSNPSNAVIGDGQGTGFISNDDGAIPTAVNDAFSTAINTPLSVAAPGVLGNDTANGLGALSAVLVSPPSHGGLTLDANGGFTYTPTGGYSGGDSFVYFAQAAGGASSNVATVSLTVNAVTTVQPVQNLYVANVTGNRVTLRWTPPAAGPAPTSYVLEGGVTPGSVMASIPVSPLPLFTFDAPTGAFYVRLRSLAGATSSGPSNEVPLFVNVPAPPSAPATLLGLVNGSGLSLQWRNTFGGGAPAGAILDVTGAAVLSMPLGATETFSFGGVPPGTYTMRVRSANAGGSSAASNAVTLTFPSGCSGAPLAPTRFLAYAAGSTLNLVWEAPASGAAATSYVIDASGSISISVPVAGTSLSSPVPNGTYALSVRAVNACGSSPATAVQTVTVP